MSRGVSDFYRKHIVEELSRKELEDRCVELYEENKKLRSQINNTIDLDEFKEFGEYITSDKDRTSKFLQDAGIHDKNGNLTPKYR